MKSTILLAMAAIGAAAAFLTGAWGHEVTAGIIGFCSLIALWASDRAMERRHRPITKKKQDNGIERKD